MQRLEKEVLNALPPNEIATFSNTQDLPYLNAVIQESMRVEPIVAVGRRLFLVDGVC